MRVDELAGISYVESSSQLLQFVSSSPKTEQDVRDRYKKMVSPAMRLILPDREYVCDPRVGRITERKKDTILFVEAPLFDFRIFGWASESSFNEGHSVENVLNFLKKDLKAELNFHVGQDKVASLGNEETRLHIDRGNWPIELKVWSSMRRENRYVKESVRIGLVKFEDEWLPNRVDWKNENNKLMSELSFDFKWISFNETIDPDKMSVAYMARKLDENSEK